MTTQLHTEPRIHDPDDFYARLIALHEGLSITQSHELNCKLVLLLANQVGDRGVLDEVLDIGRKYRPGE